MRIASFNVENFFARARALNTESRASGKPVLAAHAELNTLLGHATYTDPDKDRILALLDVLGLTASDTAEFAVLRQVRRRLVVRRSTGVVEVVADGRGDWVGWVELTTEPVTETAVANTARVVRDVNADVLGVVEADNRVVLKRSADAELRYDDKVSYPHVMLVDGNDDRGIDVAILTKRGWPLETIRSHVDDTDDRGVIFSRDCPEYEVDTPEDHRLGGADQPPQVQRLRQTDRQQRPP